eukprot:Nk52_evm7s2325 gene=Nk52_evmTU7s2325
MLNLSSFGKKCHVLTLLLLLVLLVLFISVNPTLADDSNPANGGEDPLTKGQYCSAGCKGGESSLLGCCAEGGDGGRSVEEVYGEEKARKGGERGDLEVEVEDTAQEEVVDRLPLVRKDMIKTGLSDSNNNTSFFHSSCDFDLNRPIQLVRPDSTHTKLEVVEENLCVLTDLPDDISVAVVAVVGPFHSGKSFLLNQLIGENFIHEDEKKEKEATSTSTSTTPGETRKEDAGFKLGPSVEPTTMGIWSWGRPQIVVREPKNPGNVDDMSAEEKQQEEEKVAVLYLDTEGFSARNISETYDAKIFAVSALLSSYLVYNSVKIIDQSAIDYLELLARRTQLFGLKAQLAGESNFDFDLISFPPLLWVVEDFFQDTMNDETPSDWLKRLMESSSRDSRHTINLNGIFPSVECHTMFLPATSRELLRDLSKATEKDLTEEYRMDRDKLRQLVKDKIQSKQRNSKPISGAELASLLRLLVHAANQGSLGSMPSIWSMFINQQSQNAKEDCVEFYSTYMKNNINEASITRFHEELKPLANEQSEDESASKQQEDDEAEIMDSKKGDAELGENESLLLKKPVSEDLLEQVHKEALLRANYLFTQLLYGFKDIQVTVNATLQKTISDRYLSVLDGNRYLIEQRCAEVERAEVTRADELLNGRDLPMASADFAKLAEEMKVESLGRFSDELEPFKRTDPFRMHTQSLSRHLDSVKSGFELKNLQAIEELLHQAIVKAKSVYFDMTENTNRLRRKPTDLRELCENAYHESMRLFRSVAKVTEHERPHSAFLAELKRELRDLQDEVDKDNDELIRHRCHLDKEKVLLDFKELLHSFIFPLDERELQRRLGEARLVAMRSFGDLSRDFIDHPVVKSVVRTLETELHTEAELKTMENVNAFKKIVLKPLKDAAKIIKLHTRNYWTEFTFVRMARQVCLDFLEENFERNFDGRNAEEKRGHSLEWTEPLKLRVVEEFIYNDLKSEIDIIRSWQSVSVVGFFTAAFTCSAMLVFFKK